MKNAPINKRIRRETEEFLADMKSSLTESDEHDTEPDQKWFARRMLERQIALIEESLTWTPPDE